MRDSLSGHDIAYGRQPTATVSIASKWRGLLKISVFTWFLGGAATVHLLICSFLLSNFPTVDEIGHLPAAVSHWQYQTFDMYRVNPPLVRMLVGWPACIWNDDYDWHRYTATVGSRPEFTIGLAALSEQHMALSERYVLPRLIAVVLFSIGGMLTLSIWVKHQLGAMAGCVTAALWAFSPDFIAHGATIGPDVGSTAMLVVACIACWSYAHSPSYISAGWAGGALGLAMLTKFTCLTMFVTLPLCVLLISPWLPWRPLACRIGDLFVYWSLALLVVNFGYLGEGTLIPLREYEFCSHALGGEGCNAGVHGNRFAHSWLGVLPVPFPRNFLLGIDFLKYEVEEKKWSFLCGRWRFGSWPHYYVMTTLFKTPEPTLILALIGFCLAATAIAQRKLKMATISMLTLLTVPACASFASVSAQGGFNHHHRYVLQIYPAIFVLAAYVASPEAASLVKRCWPLKRLGSSSIAVPIAIVLTSLSIASVLRVHPYYTSYFNSISGGPENGWRLLGFSNVDWGQDLHEVQDWIKRHPDSRPLAFDLDYFGYNGELFGLPPNSPPSLPSDTDIADVALSESQWWIVSVKKLYDLPGYNGLEYLQRIEPYAKIAYAYHVYRIEASAKSATSD